MPYFKKSYVLKGRSGSISRCLIDCQTFQKVGVRLWMKFPESKVIF